jgi:hypothetical protein
MFHIKIIDRNHYFRLSTPRTTKKLFVISAVYHLTHYLIQKYAFFVGFLVPIPNGDLQYLKKTFWCPILRQKRESSFLNSNFNVCPMLDQAGVRPDRSFFF